MDERSIAVDNPETIYRCPGEVHAIERAVHLGRLAAFYPACQHCAHRDETHSLAPVQIRQQSEVARRARRGPAFAGEGLESTSPHDMTPAVVRRASEALGIVLAGERVGSTAPTVLVGSQGDWTTAELVAAACEALQWSGCRTLEVGAVTSASLVAAMQHTASDAALFVGNASGEPHALSLKFWGGEARPWSSPGKLDRLRDAYAAPADRPTRRGGGLERACAAELYLAPLQSLFHGLRPLRMVLDTRCQPLVDYLLILNAESACEVLRPRGGLGTDVANVTPLERRLNIVSRQVLADGAHLGIWMDGDGERCRLVDERGRVVDVESLFLLLARYICGQRAGAIFMLEHDASDRLADAVNCWGARTLRCRSTRQAMCEAIRRAGATFGGGTSGRFWYGEGAGAPDALMTLCLLLTILSQSDRSLSEVLDAA